MNFSDIYVEHSRICILRTLAGSGYKCNDSILHDILTKKFAIVVDRDQVKTQVAWLRDQGLVDYEELPSHTYIVTITQRGLDVASGNATVPGVKRPSPGELHG